MNKDYKQLVDDLLAIGLKKGDSLMIHSSYKSMGGLEGGIETFLEAVLSVLGESGTLISPTFTFRAVSVDNPVFDYVNTPSCTGAINEFIRHLPYAKRSIHPTHSCTVIGKKTDYYVNGHELDRTPVGENSPVRKLMEDGGKILMLGCGLGPNSSLHGVEEMAKVPYVLPKSPSPYTIILPDKTYTIDYYRHHIVQNGFLQRYGRLERLIDDSFVKRAPIHGANSYLIDAPWLWKVGVEALSKDPYFFVEKKEG